MRLNFSSEDELFRIEVKEFIANFYPKDLQQRRIGEYSKEEYLSWHRILAEKGWVAPHWSKDFGGPSWTASKRYIFEEECAKAETIIIWPFGITMLAPVLMNFGNEQQQAYYLPRILSGEDWWCQGYSEPGAGSDLASLKTKAVRDGDRYIVNGHKTWTTLGQYADWIFCLVRTSSEDRPQKGISFLLIDLASRGIEMRPIKTIDGGREINEVFFTDVHVPVANLVGEEGAGWDIAKFLLSNERGSIIGVARSQKIIEEIKEIAHQEYANGIPLIEDALFLRKLSSLEIELEALRYTELRTLAAEAQGHMVGAEVSLLKIKATEIQQNVMELMMEVIGYYNLQNVPSFGVVDVKDFVGADYSFGVSQEYFNRRKTSIYGGSNEIQRNIIAKFVLGL